ncbi:MAG: membrane protein insertase YidC, partial [Acidithiobacillus sp.]
PAMMELYRSEKVNPMAGCLPIFIQMPVFISLYWVLVESVSLRQAPFILWIHDLAAPDPYYILPLLMGVSMFIQQRLNPAPSDPMQKRLMSALPVVFAVFFSFFPAGLVLYWLVNNLISIGQQYFITRRILAST